MKKHYFSKLIPPRPTFAQDMTDEERRLMNEHIAYTQRLFDAGKVLIYGPVIATDGAFGMAVLEVEDEAEARRYIENDPAKGLNKFDLYPMQVAASRAKGE